jgi:hypothetical protein
LLLLAAASDRCVRFLSTIWISSCFRHLVALISDTALQKILLRPTTKMAARVDEPRQHAGDTTPSAKRLKTMGGSPKEFSILLKDVRDSQLDDQTRRSEAKSAAPKQEPKKRALDVVLSVKRWFFMKVHMFSRIFIIAIVAQKLDRHPANLPAGGLEKV